MPVFGSFRARWKKKVQKDLVENPAWTVRVGRGWVCPYCLEVAHDELPDEAEARADAVLDHLIDSECAPFKNGEGQEHPVAEVRRAAASRELRRRVKRDLVRSPSWQLMDLRRRWYCPFCSEATETAIPQDQRMTDDIVRGIAQHVEACFAYERGRGAEKPLEQLKSVVKTANRTLKLSEDVKRRLEQDPAWRKKDGRGRWVCPLCQKLQEQVDLSTTLGMFENAPSLIARHLLIVCQGYAGRREELGSGLTRVAPASSPQNPALIPDTVSDAWLGVEEHQPPRPGTPSSMPPPAIPTTPSRAIPRTPAGAQAQGKDARWKEEDADDGSKVSAAFWGKDAIAAERLGKEGMTLRKLESSGDSLMIDDPEIKRILSGGASAKPATGRLTPGPMARPPEPPRAPEPSHDWRAEIERELEAVKSQVQSGTSDSNARAMEDSVQAEAREVSRVAQGLPGFEVRAFARPAVTPRGDFVEAIRTEDGRLAILLGGVAGTEPEGALVAAMARNLLRVHAAREPSAAEVLRRTNKEIFADLDARTFVSAALFFVDTRRRVVEVARAGLTPPALVNRRRGAAPFQLLETEGMVMGIDKGPIFDQTVEARRIDLLPGDLLFATTNGVLELRSAAREELGAERLQGLVRRYGTHEAEYLAHKLSRFLDDWGRGTDPQADTCFVAMKVEEPA